MLTKLSSLSFLNNLLQKAAGYTGCFFIFGKLLWQVVMAFVQERMNPAI